MLVRPCRVSASPVNHAENAVRTHKFPRENGVATVGWIPRQLFGIDGIDAAVGQRSAGSAAIQLGLVDINAFFVFGPGAGRGCVCSAGACCNAVARRCRRGVEVPRIGNIVVNASERGAASGDDRRQAGKGVRRL
jgi:hypothetical protein